jgi:hypothetical protein
MREIDIDDDVRETLRNARGDAAQRAHCAALTRFARVCAHLSLSWEHLKSVDELHPLLAKVLDWSGRNGAPAADLKRIRTAVSVLFGYRFNTLISELPIVKSVVHRHLLHDLPTRTPLRLSWDLPQLLQHVAGMGANQDLSHTALVQKCVVLVMATTCARFTEMQQFRREGSDPEGDDQRRWAFTVRVKNREYLQPIILHHMRTETIDPILAMIELRVRVRRLREMCEIQKDTFWYNANGIIMRYEDIRHAAQQVLSDAGIHDHRAYHIKHATISWLHSHGVSSDKIIRFIRHALGSTTYMEYYLSEDLGEQCTGIIESTALPGAQRSGESAPHGKEGREKKEDTEDVSVLQAIAESIDTAMAAPLQREQPKSDRARRTPRH